MMLNCYLHRKEQYQIFLNELNVFLTRYKKLLSQNQMNLQKNLQPQRYLPEVNVK